jgi:hypothetical protein
VVGLVKFDLNLEEFSLSGVTELKNVRDRYFKFKRGGKWNRVEIANVDKYRKSTYKTLETLAYKLFENVCRGTRRVPCIVKDDNGKRYVTRFLFEDKETMVISKLFPKFLKRYPTSEKFSLAAFYTGNRKMMYEYYDKEKSKSSDQLFFDLRLLHTQILANRLNPTQTHQLINRFYSDITTIERQNVLTKSLTKEEEKSLEKPQKTISSMEVFEKLETQPQPEPELVDPDEVEPSIVLEEVTPPLEHVESKIKQYKGSLDFERNFVLKAADLKLQETLEKVIEEERRNQLVLTFYRLMKGHIEPREFYEKTKM